MTALAIVRPAEARVAQPVSHSTVIECVIRVATGTARTYYSHSGRVFSHKRSEAKSFATFAEAQEYAYQHLLSRHDVLDVAFLVGSV